MIDRKIALFAGLAALAGLAGCASVGAQEKEGQLSAAGFVRLQADTPERVAQASGPTAERHRLCPA